MGPELATPGSRTRETEVRLAIARRAAVPWAADPRVRSVLLTGSVARGIADDHSDVDTIVFWDTPPDDAEMRTMIAAAQATGGDFHLGTAEEGFALYHFVDGIRCDFGHGSVADHERQMTAVLEHADTDLEHHLLASGFLIGVPLHGDAWIAGWMERLRRFPEALVTAMLERHLRFMPRWALERMGAERGDVLFLSECHLQTIERLTGVLCGLNRLYHPGKLKGLASTVDAMTIRPPDFLARCERLLSLPPHEGVALAVALIEETFALVERHAPDFDTAPARARWNRVYRR